MLFLTTVDFLWQKGNNELTTFGNVLKLGQPKMTDKSFQVLISQTRALLGIIFV